MRLNYAAFFLLRAVARSACRSSSFRRVDAVRVVAAGEALLAPTVTRRLIADMVARTATPAAPPPRPGPAAAVGRLAGLSPRETDTLRALARGLSNAEIAAELYVTEHTVKTHVSNLLAKLGLRDRVQAVVLAYESGLVVAGPAHPPE